MKRCESCESCIFWLDTEDKKRLPEFQQGLCRRNPPNGCGMLIPHRSNAIAQPTAQNVELRPLEFTVWPVTHKDSWCGEYNGREKGTEYN